MKHRQHEMTRWFLAIALGALACLRPDSAFAQTMPTGTLQGQVTDSSGLSLPGATVTVTSSSLQGPRTATTSANGDYVIPFLPPGEYSVKIELSGFQSHQRAVRIQVSAAVTHNAQLGVGSLEETVEVRAETAEDFTLGSQITSSLKAEMIDRLPVGRDLTGAALLAPGTTDGGYRGQITFNGALSYENQFLVNGVVVNDPKEGNARELFIEDAIEETQTSTGALSAEFGRFSGGVVNTITKSGGNQFSGSFRTTMDNEKWRSRTPIEKNLAEDPRVDKLTPTYEATLGGPIMRDKVWFFGAGRYVDRTFSEATVYTNIPFERGAKDVRGEGKVTWSVTSKQTVKASFMKRKQDFLNDYGSTPFMDLKYLWDSSSQDEDVIAVNYTAVIRPTFFVEAQFSRRHYFLNGEGSTHTDFVNGTVFYDQSRGLAKWNAPAGCSVCGPDGSAESQTRHNKNGIIKATWFLSTSNAGAHTVVFGGDVFQEGRYANVYAAGGTYYRFYIDTTIIRGTDLYPSITPDVAYFQWNPVDQKAIPNALRTYSAFANDDWRLNDHLRFNVGVRWDKVDAKDAAGANVIQKPTLSPRLSATFDPNGDGKWLVNAGLARYVMSATSNITDLGSAAGKQSVYQFWYQGPAINADVNTPSPTSAGDAITTAFDWFFANGGTDRSYKRAPRLPGLTRQAGKGLITPSTWEYTVGLARQLGSKGSARLDAIFRDYRDFYADRVDGVTGQVTSPTGALADLDLVVNTNHVEKTYKALMAQMQYRFSPKFNLGGNYTLSQNRGSFEGENETTGAITDVTLVYPEYRQLSWTSPVGDLASDRRHKVRVWGSYSADLGSAGRLDIGVLQSLTSGKPYGAIGNIDPRSYVTNPGYRTPPSAVPYFFTARDAFHTDTVTATNLSLNYVLPVHDRRAQFFARFVADNLFNQSAYTGAGTRTEVATVATNVTDKSLAKFDPFNTTPVEGVNYRIPSTFGQPLSSLDYQSPRRLYVSLGVRF